MAVTPAAIRKQQQKERERKAIAKLGGGRFSVLAYGETMAALDALAKHYGFSGKQYRAETVTHLIHEMHDIVTNHKTEETTK